MLKWAVNSKRAEGQVPSRLSLESSGALDIDRRRSLVAPQGRRKNRRSLHNMDKENLDFIGCTPEFSHKDVYSIRKLEYTSKILKDVSNLTPKSATPSSPGVRISTPNRRSIDNVECVFGLESRFAITPTTCLPRSVLPSQPFLKKRRILLDTAIYVDGADVTSDTGLVKSNLNTIKNERRNHSELASSQNTDINLDKKKDLSTSMTDFETQLTNSSEPKHNTQRVCIEQPLANVGESINTIRTTSLPTFEIEYSPCTLSSKVSRDNNEDERNSSACLSTLPVIGSRIFINNPLYFNVDNLSTEESIQPNRPKVNFVDNFTSLLNKLSPLSALRHNGRERAKLCSEVSPLARKMASLCFNRMHANPLSSPQDETVNAARATMEIIKRRPLLAMRDDEVSIELETKTISERSPVEDQSTITDSKMGDVTLERMIEDILKSTKKVRQARKVKIPTRQSKEQHNLKNTKEVLKNHSEIMSNTHLSIGSVLPVSPRPIQNSNIEIKSAIIKSAKNDSSLSDKPAGNTNRTKCMEQEKTFIVYDPLNSSEREVKTPENRLSHSSHTGAETMLKNCLEKCSLTTMIKSNPRKRANSLGVTPTHNKTLPHDCDFNLKRQRCVRRKRYCHREEIEDTVSLPMESGLTLKTGIPSPFTPENQSLSRILKSSSYNSVTGYPFLFNPSDDVEYFDKNSYQISDHQISSPTLNYINYKDIPASSVSNSSFMLGQYSMEKKSSSYTNSKMFGLTLECGIPSPSSPFTANRFLELDTPGFCSSFLTDSSTQKFADDSVDILSEPATPVVEFRSSRRCLTYSPEEDDLRCLEMRSSMNNARSRQGIVQTQTSGGTIDLAMQCKDDQISVHISRCRNLQRSNGSSKNINAYVKVSISGMGTYQRTPVKRDCSSPQFEKHFLLPIPARGGGRRIQVSVWHRDSLKRRSEFLGCMSFPVRHALRRALVGPFRLHAARPHRARPSPAMAAPAAAPAHQPEQMDAGSALAARLALQQREADDHLFLRYLELDPLEGPDAAPAAVQRKASAGGRAGRTPFTSTRRLDRGSDQGFGFSVLWTRPPRVERVDAGRAAERAGLYPGDYIVFVDRHNVVTMPESQVLSLIKSCGTQLILETFRRAPGETRTPAPSRAARGSVTSHATVSDAAPYSPAPLPRQLLTRLTAESDWPNSRGNRPSTACSNNTARSEAAATSVASKKRPTLTQVAFTRESLSALGGPTASGSPSEMGRALHALVLREQHYAQALHFGVERFVVPMASRTDILTPQEHKLLFQNLEELLRLSEDILEQLVMEDGEIHFHSVASVYLSKMSSIISLYKSYCNGLKRADCVLVQKSRQPGGAFTRFCTEPTIPSRRPDVTQLIHKPLEQFRELLRLLRTANTTVTSTHPDQRALARLVADLQVAYHDVTAGAGLMGPIGEGRPLLSVADLESRLVFTRCKPFVLAKPGRQWIFGGDLFRVEGRTCRSHWALLFSDLLLFATVSRDRVLFITEEPLPIANITETCFSIRKRPTEFRIGVGSARASSPTMKCGPPVRARTRTIILRAPTADLKAVWQTLLLRQILRVNSSTGTPLSSPMESPAPLGCYSEVTLDSQQHQTVPSPRAPAGQAPPAEGAPRPSPCRGAALHLARWMKSHPGSGELSEPEPEVWSAEQLRKRSQELRLVDVAQAAAKQSAAAGVQTECNKSPSENERSPSRSTNSDSQITVRSSPVVPETVAVCRQCHKRCFSKPGSPQVSAKTPTPTDRKSLTSPVCNNNTFLSASHTCQKKLENKSECLNRCKKEVCIAETKITSSPEKIEKKIEPPPVETVSPRVAIRRSREEFFKTSITKESNMSHFDRASKSPASRSPSSQRSSDSSRSTLFSTNSLLSFAHTTCSSMALSTSTGKTAQSPERSSNASEGSEKDEVVQCVIAQERYLNEVKCVENVVLSKNHISRARLKDMKSYCNVSKTFSEKSVSASPKTQNKYLVSESACCSADKANTAFSSFNPDFYSVPTKATVNGDIRRIVDYKSSNTETTRSSVNFSWSPLMLMGLSSMNPAAHLLALETENERPRPNQPYKPPTTSPTRLPPNISVVPPTPDFKSDGKNLMTQHTLEESPDDSPIAEDPPYTALKRYGTMSSLERLPSDEIDDIQLTADQPANEKDVETSQGLLSWTSRAGSYVAEKMALLNSLAESGAASTGASFLERYLGTGEWRAVRGSVGGAEGSGGEGSGASGEEAWGTPSSGDLSDHAFPDSDHATLSSPTKSSSSCPGDDDTELMMDELLMTPPIAGPSLRPLLPRRRLEPLLEEDGSDSSSTSSVGAESEVTPSPTDKQESSAAGGAADGGARAAGRLCGGPGWPGGAREIEDPELTPTNGPPGHASPLLSSGSPPLASDTERGSTCASTASEETLAGPESVPSRRLVGNGGSGDSAERLSPRMEMRLALQEGRDILAEQDQLWDQVNARSGWVRRCFHQPRPRALGTPTIITSHSSASAQQDGAKVTAMERLALMEARGGRRGGRRLRPTARLMGLVRRRASSDSPERRPYSPRRQQPHVSSHGYYKICFVNGFV